MRANAATPAGSAWGATSGGSAGTRGGLCRPPQLCEAYWGFSCGAQIRPPPIKRINPACPIDNIFVPTGNIGGRGRVKERKGRSKRPQGPAGGRGEKSRRGRTERGRFGMATQQGRYGAEDDCTGEDDGKGGVQAKGPRCTVKQRQRQGGGAAGTAKERATTRARGGAAGVRGIRQRRRRRMG